jgi:hypothetical protein
MKIINKKQLLENLELDVDEDVFKRKDPHLPPKPKWDKKTGAFKISKATPYWKKDSPDKIPHYWVLNPSKTEGGDIVVVPLDCQQLDEFINENRDWLKEIEDLHGIEPQLIECKRPMHAPDNKNFSTRSNLGGKQSLPEKINRKFLKILRSEFGDQSEKGREFNEVLNLRSIPAIMLEVWKSRNYINNHVPKYTNNLITFQSLNFNSYQSANQFLNAVVDRVRGVKNDNMNTYYLARQFNNKYTNWEEDRKAKKHYEGKTPVYKLDKRGYYELNLDVTLQTLFSVVGKKVNNNFIWQIKMKNKFGRKRSDENYIKDGLSVIRLDPNGYLDDNVISSSVTVPMDKEHNDDFTVMDDAIITGALMQCISDFKQKLESINPKSALKIATYGKKDIVKTN